jgi:hypothetical protein
MNLVDLSSATVKDALVILIQNEAHCALRVSTAFIIALLSVLGLPVFYIRDYVAGPALHNIVLC